MVYPIEGLFVRSVQNFEWSARDQSRPWLFLLAMRLEAGMEFLRGLLVPFLLLLFLPDFLLMTLSSQAICE